MSKRGQQQTNYNLINTAPFCCPFFYPRQALFQFNYYLIVCLLALFAHFSYISKAQHISQAVCLLCA